MNNSENIFLRKHQILETYFFKASGVEQKEDSNLIEDTSYTYSNDLDIKAEESLRTKGELIKYKTKDGTYKGVACTWIMWITKKGIEAFQDEKYLKEWRNEKFINTTIDNNVAIGKVNTSIINTNIITRVSAIITIFILIGTLLISYLNYEATKANQDVTKRLLLLEQQQQENKLQLSKTTSLIDSIQKSLIKKTKTILSLLN